MGCCATTKTRRQKHQDHEKKAKDEAAFNQKLEEVFKQYDADGNGSLDRDEVRKLLNETMASKGRRKKEMTDREVQEFINACDQNHNGMIEKNELFDLFKRLTEDPNA